MWVKCHVCNGLGYKHDKECLMCKFYIIREEDGTGREDERLILRGRIWISDNFIDPFTPPSTP
jgi:hypothetical protein